MQYDHDVDYSNKSIEELIPPPELMPEEFWQEKGMNKALYNLYRNQVIERELQTPKVGENAPDFELELLRTAVDGTETIRLSDLYDKPVALIFGNYSCPIFRGKFADINAVYEQYSQRINFLMVYTQEVHTDDAWQVKSNMQCGITYCQPTKLNERIDIADRCATDLSVRIPTVVDGMDNQVDYRYGGTANRLYLIDTDGVVIFRTGLGPWQLDIDAWRSAIESNL